MLRNDNNCLGCFACANICPKQAISFVENAVGAIEPQILNDYCVKCGLCEDVCPIIHKPESYPVINCYAAWSKDRRILEKAASGGIASTIYRLFVREQGVSFGAEYVNTELVFSASEDELSLEGYSGSKYVHAYVGDSYSKVKHLLQLGRKVVFVGTPCQIAGLKSFLHKSSENLFLIDIICHGVVPQKYLKEYVTSLCGITYDRVMFRGEKGNRIAVYKDNNLVYCEQKWFDPFSMAYACGLICRECCYQCPFTSEERQGDLTIGDFWGLDRGKLKVNSLEVPFVSLVLVNTEKGQKLVQTLEREIYLEKRPFGEALSGNKQLYEPCQKNREREFFLSNLKKRGFMYALKKTKIYRDVKFAQKKNNIRNCFNSLKTRIFGEPRT